MTFQAKKLIDFFTESDFPCLMSQAVMEAGNYTLHKYNGFGSELAAEEIISDVSEFIQAHDFDSNKVESFLAVFPDSPMMDELQFEKQLWLQLNFLHEKDPDVWDDSVSANGNDPKFSFSICGKAFYIIGMHPGSSRLSRRTPYTTLVFNLHHQFEILRNRKVYQHLKQRIRERDKLLQGSENPMLNDFGEESEARQYSGRNVGRNWKCPLHADKNHT